MVDERVGSATAGRQVEEHTEWMTGRQEVGHPGARRTRGLRTGGNNEHEMH